MGFHTRVTVGDTPLGSPGTWAGRLGCIGPLFSSDFRLEHLRDS
jgi:hypothetical protein